MQTSKPTYIICADGACSGNPGPGGFAWELWVEEVVEGNEITGGAGSSLETTNNIMELRAAIDAFEEVRDMVIKGSMDPAVLKLRFDSEYVLKGIFEWLPGWKSRGWRTGAGKPVKNLELWQQMDELLADMEFRQMTLEKDWVKGHAGDLGNERVDAKAVEMRDLAKAEFNLATDAQIEEELASAGIPGAGVDLMAIAEEAGADTRDGDPAEMVAVPFIDTKDEGYDPASIEVLKGLDPVAPRDTLNVVDAAPAEVTPDQVRLMRTILELYESGDYSVKKVVQEIRANAISLGCR